MAPMSIKQQRFFLAVFLMVLLAGTVACAIFFKLDSNAKEILDKAQSALIFACGLTFQFFFDKGE